jgi:hypothetical protein
VGRSANQSLTWSDLETPARLFRIAHATWGILNLSALTWLWSSALARHRGRGVTASVVLLVTEGLALVVGRGNCPFGPFQSRLGDPVPIFEWVLPPRAAKAAIPALTAVTFAAFVAVALRPPTAHRSRHGRWRAVRDA